MGFIKPNNNSGGSGGGLTPQELSRLNNAYTHSKSEHAPTTAEQNVQPDWNETDTTSDAYIKNKPDLSQIGSGGNIPSVTQIEPQELDMPKVFFYGNALPTTKDNVNLTMDYISNTAKFSSFVKLKCQGTSSMSYAKKNFTVAMYSDEARATKLKKDFKGWGAQSKFCLKANYVDTTHTRNLSGARIAYDMVASRPDSAFKQQLLQCPRNGLVDGFPIKLYFNGEFYGIYTWNIPKDTWMFNMDKSNLNHIVLCAEKNTDGNSSAINSCQFRQLWTNGDGQDWSVEVGTMSEDLRTKFNRVIAFVMNATDQEFHDNIGEYFDLYSLLDYYCFSYLTCHLDGLAKNMLMVTYDGVIWGASLYDMDSIYGVSWNGASFVSPQYQCPEQYQEQFSRLWVRIEACFGAELYARYLELRQGALSLSNIIKHVEEIYDVIPDRVFADEKAKWTSLPNVNTNTMTRFRNYMRDRAVYVDAQMKEIGINVPCTGIVLSADTLSFTTTDTQTLSVVVSPDNTTDTVNWSVSPTNIVTVDNGVVTPVSNGTCTITATCGSYSDTCAVTVSGMSESGGGTTGNYVTDNLYAYYDLTQLSTEATTVEDLSGNNNTFNVISGTLTKDDLGGLIYNNNSLRINSTTFNPQTAEASIEYTFKYTGMDNCDSTGNFPNRTCGINGDNGHGYYCWLGGYGYTIFKGHTQIATDKELPNKLVNGEYYHVVCTFGDSEIKIYLNGELLGTHAHNITGIPSNCTYYLGNTTNSGTPAQVLYSSRFYNKVLTQDEITQNYTYEFTKLGLISGGGTDIYATAEYAITEPRTFNGASDYIDTGIKLFDTAKTFTIFVDYTTSGTVGVGKATIFHCLHEEAPYRGLCLMEAQNDDVYFIGGHNNGGGYATNMPSTGKYMISFVNGVINNVVTLNNSNKLVYSGTGMASTNPYVQISENLLIGCYQDNSGNKGRYWSGTINKFGVWYKQLTEAEINKVFGISGGNTEGTLLCYYDSADLTTNSAVWTDKTGNGRDLTINNNSEASLDITDQGLLFYNVYCRTPELNIPLTGNFTVEYELTRLGNISGVAMYAFNSTVNKTCVYCDSIRSNHVYAVNGYNTDTNTDLILTQDHLYKIRVIYGNEITLYADGVLIGTYTRNAFTANGTYQLCLGFSGDQKTPILNSRIKSFKLWDGIVEPSGGDTPSTNPNLVFQVNSASMNTADNTLTDNIAGISATLTGNPTVSDNQIAFTANDKFNFDISSLNLTNSNRTFRIKFTPTSLDNTPKNVMALGSSANVWNSATTCYISSANFVLQHGSNNFTNVTMGSENGGNNSNRLPASPVTGQEYELVISENTNGNIRWFIDGVLVQDGTTALFNPLYIGNIEGNSRFTGSYSLIEIYNGYCNDYTEFTNMINSRNN